MGYSQLVFILLATRLPQCPCPVTSFPLVLHAPCCQLPKDICSHPLLCEKALMHDFRVCQNIQHLLVFEDAANLTTRKSSKLLKSDFLAKKGGKIVKSHSFSFRNRGGGGMGRLTGRDPIFTYKTPLYRYLYTIYSAPLLSSKGKIIISAWFYF